jgi:hypothetical protein
LARSTPPQPALLADGHAAPAAVVAAAISATGSAAASASRALSGLAPNAIERGFTYQVFCT